MKNEKKVTRKARRAQPTYTYPYQDRAKRAWYVNDSHGTRRSVILNDGGGWTFRMRPGKAARKAEKRAGRTR